MSGRYIGIDLGTTNSVASVLFEVNGRRPELKVLQIPQPGRTGQRFVYQENLPSAVYFESPGQAVVGELAKERFNTVPYRCSRSIKSKMGRPYVMEIDGSVQTPATISAHILRAIREALCQYLNTDVREAVITVPASFTTAQREDTINAARLAGLNIEEGMLLDEPTAALLDFLHTQSGFHRDDRLLDFTVPRNLMVFDLGGGTLDISIMRVENSGAGDHSLVAEVLARSRYTNLGGDDFDLALAVHLAWEYEKATGISLASLPSDRCQEIEHRLLSKAEEVKQQLVNEYEMLSLGGAWESEPSGAAVNLIVPELNFRTRVSMKLYEQVVAHLLGPSPGYHKHILQPVEDALQEAGILPAEIDRVFLVGGMSRVPCVRKTLAGFFPGKELHPLNYDHAVARGAAIHHRYLSLGMKDIHFKDRLSEGVYILREKKTTGGWERGFAELIPREAEPGQSGTSNRNFVLNEDGQNAVRITLYRGRGEEDPLMTPLVSVKFDFKRSYPRGTRIGLRWRLDRNKKIRVEGWLVDYPDEKPFVLEVEGSYLSEEELEELRANS